VLSYAVSPLPTRRPLANIKKLVAHPAGLLFMVLVEPGAFNCQDKTGA
jgi:hypothetical protein